MADYIPQNDADMNVWQGNLLEIIDPNLTDWGISADDFTAVKSKQFIWEAAYTKASNKQNRTSADVLAKDEAGADYKKIIRSFVAQWLANNTRVTDADRTRMGLTVKSGTRTASHVPTSSLSSS